MPYKDARNYAPLDVAWKDSVDPQGVSLQIVRAIVMAAGVWARHGKPLTLTSLNDSRHSARSLHYEGKAVDLRTRDEGPSYAQWPPEMKERLATELRAGLGSDYDVVVERTHIHVEFDPK